MLFLATNTRLDILQYRYRQYSMAGKTKLFGMWVITWELKSVRLGSTCAEGWEGGKLLNCHGRISCGTPCLLLQLQFSRNNEMRLCLSSPSSRIERAGVPLLLTISPNPNRPYPMLLSCTSLSKRNCKRVSEVAPSLLGLESCPNGTGKRVQYLFQ